MCEYTKAFASTKKYSLTIFYRRMKIKENAYNVGCRYTNHMLMCNVDNKGRHKAHTA